MDNVARGRRRFLLQSVKVAFLWSFLLPDYVIGQTTPRPPDAPSFGSGENDPSKININLDAYERWLDEIYSAANRLAIDSDTEYRPEYAEEFQNNAKNTLERNGYSAPSPPTNLRVE